MMKKLLNYLVIKFDIEIDFKDFFKFEVVFFFYILSI